MGFAMGMCCCGYCAITPTCTSCLNDLYPQNLSVEIKNLGVVGLHGGCAATCDEVNGTYILPCSGYSCGFGIYTFTWEAGFVVNGCSISIQANVTWLNATNDRSLAVNLWDGIDGVGWSTSDLGVGAGNQYNCTTFSAKVCNTPVAIAAGWCAGGIAGSTAEVTSV